MNIYLSLFLLVNIFSVSTSNESGKGLLVAGGYDFDTGYVSDQVEFIDLETLTSCIVDVTIDMPRQLHTGDGDLVCGGTEYDLTSFDSCYNIVTGATINLNSERYNHVSWSRANGQETYLLGGKDRYASGAEYVTTSELITGDTTETAFDLQYDIE